MSNLTDAVDTIAKRLLLLASEEATLRQDLRSLAKELLTALDEIEQTDESPPEQPDTAAISVSPSENADLVAPVPTPTKNEPEPAIETSVLPELPLGQSQPPTEAPPPTSPAHWRDAEPDLYMIEKRCRLKAEGL